MVGALPASGLEARAIVHDDDCLLGMGDEPFLELIQRHGLRLSKREVEFEVPDGRKALYLTVEAS